MIGIKDISGNILLSTLPDEGCKRKFTLMKEDYITLKFSLENPIYFKLGSYVECDFGLFEVCDLQSPAFNTNTAGYDYELRLDTYYWKWKNKIFKYTPETDGQEASWNLTAPLDVQAGIVLRNLQALGYTYKGQDFVFSIDSTVENKSQLMSYDNINILDACFEMAKKWDCECWVTENIIHFGRCEFGTAVDFEIAKNVVEMPRSESRSTYATRIYAFGSTRNIPTNYRPVDESVVVNGVVQKRLMLPEGIPYIDAYPNMRTEEAIEQVVIFDEVYPRRTGTMSDITTHEYTETIENADGTTTEKKWDAYRFKDTGITFSKDYVLPGEELKITFQSGKLNGMVFAVTFNPYDKEGGETAIPEKNEDGSWNPAAQVWEIVRNEDYGRKLPGDLLVPENGDTYILSGWDSTKIAELGLVSTAEQELKEKAEKRIAKSKTDPSTYTCKMMPDDAYMEDDIHNLYGIGQKVNLINKAYFENGRQSRVIGFEFNLDYPFDSPVYTVGETAAYSRIGELEEKIENITLAGQTYTGGGGSGVYLIRRNDSTPATDSNVFSALRSLVMFLRKDIAESVKYLMTFLGGIVVKKFVKIGEFITGVSGIYADENGDMEVGSLYARKRVFVPEIAYNRTTYFKGRMVNSPGGGCTVLSYVDNGNGTYTITPDLTDADGLSQFVDDILTTYFVTKNAEGKLNGFEEMKFRVTAADYTAKKFTVIPRPGYDWKPAEQMVLAQTGNFTDPERQTYILFDSVNGNNCITFFDHANTWDPEPAQMPSWLGKKKGMTVAGINADNYSAVLQNIIMTGLIFQVDEITGQSVRVPLDKGKWVAGKYAYYDRVSHNGSLWLCVNDKGTTAEPATGNSDWLKQVSEGAQGEPGISVVGGGHWEASQTPYKASTIVSFANCVFMSKVETSNPPIKIARFKNGNLIRKKDGGYILAGRSSDWTVNDDWDLLLDGRELKGESFTFLGEFPTAPSNPSEGDTYRNTTDHCTYTYHNGIWMVMTKDGTDGKDGTDYEWIYKRTNIIGIPPEKPDSKQQDDYVPEGWTDDFLGVDADHQVEWACKRVKRNGMWSEFSDPAPVHRWAKDGEPGKDGKDGTSIETAGHWESANAPYTKGKFVTMFGASFVAKIDTSNPPISISRFKNGNYRKKRNGGYILAGSSADWTVNDDWQMVTPPADLPMNYTLFSAVDVININSVGSPTPSSMLVTCKTVREKSTSLAGFVWLAARKYNGSWLPHVSAVQSATLSLPATAGYTQFAIRAYLSQSDANIWNDNYVAEKGIGVVKDGINAEPGQPGAFPRDRGEWEANAQPYVWNADYRDKVIYPINGVYYNFLVKTYGASVTAAPTSADGDSNWEAMSKFNNIATDTMFADNANIGGFAYARYQGENAGIMKSQNGALEIDGKYGKIKCKDAEIEGKVTAKSGSFTGIIHATDGDFSGELIGVTGSFKELTCMDGDKVVAQITFDPSGRLWFNGDIYHQGTKDGRSLRFYTSDVWCRGAFGARSRTVAKVNGPLIDFYINGVYSAPRRANMQLMTAADKVTQYYIIPCQGGSDLVSDAAGMPIDTIVFVSGNEANYVLDMVETQRVHIVNADNIKKGVNIFSNGKRKLIAGGLICDAVNMASFLYPSPETSVLGRGTLITGDNDWN